MAYQVRVAGKIFEGERVRTLLKRAVEARRRKRESQQWTHVISCPSRLLEMSPVRASHQSHSR